MFVQVELDDHHLPPVDAWVEVRGVLTLPEAPDDGPVPEPPVVEATDVRVVDEPSDVYEYPP
jgi:uncharacterized membrane protein YcgQ (UPF0703/DUF1980 family)